VSSSVSPFSPACSCHRISWDLSHSLHPLSPRSEGKNRKVLC
jgi:hypothetical protein